MKNILDQLSNLKNLFILVSAFVVSWIFIMMWFLIIIDVRPTAGVQLSINGFIAVMIFIVVFITFRRQAKGYKKMDEKFNEIIELLDRYKSNDD